MPSTMNFTKGALDRLNAPDTGRAVYRDAKTPGLIVRVSTTGTKVFYRYGRIDGKPTRLKLGTYPAMVPEQARRACVKMNGQIADGDNPQTERRKARRTAETMASLSVVFDDYRTNHLTHHASPRTIRNDAYLFSYTKWAGRKLDAITPQDVKALHRRLGNERGPVMANRVVQLLRRLFNYAADELGYQGENPVKVRHGGARRNASNGGSVTLFRERSRERYLQPEECPGFFQALRDDPDPDFRDLILLLLFTGARRGNLQAMRWSEVSLDPGVWVIPMTKSGEPVTIPLSDHAVRILADRLDRRDDLDQDWVFPASKSKSGHVEEPKREWWALRERAGVPDLTMHDLRRTLGSWQAGAGASLIVIGRSLGHRTPQATSIYARLDLDPVRNSVNVAVDAMLVNVPDDGKLLPPPTLG